MNYLQIAQAYDRQSERLLEAHYAEDGFEERLQAEIQRIDEQIRKGDETLFDEFTQTLCDNDLFWLAVGSGADYLPYRQQTIEKLAKQKNHSEDLIMEFNLILSTESKVLSTNISTFQQQAENYLAGLSNRFETDDDFAQAKQDIKDLTELEKRTKEAIANAQNGEIKQLIEQAQAMAERFRQARLEREKLVKTKEAEIKASIVNDAFERLAVIKSGFENDVCIALEQVISKATIKKRLDEATKRRSTLATLTKAVNAEETLIGAEIAAEAARLSARRKLIPISYEYLFKDWLNLITGDDDLEPIIQARIADEEKREAKIKAKAEQEAKAQRRSESKP
ncbi:hypothetical protein [Avibacterium paragallinarum]|uniref:hypothetical protein n=1 Tax=Avibacterium paragallinarum TaxID=728 RepID=UPI00158005D2|nr:hypothetical protein [Avibacterium paragallinarum]